MREPVIPGWAEEQTPTPFLYHKLTLIFIFYRQLRGVYWYIPNGISMKGRIAKSSDNTYESNAFAGQKQFRFSVVCGFEMTRERLY